MKIDNTVALVTGGASGLGLATTQALLAARAHVGILDLPSSPGLSVQDAHPGSVTFLPGDVTSTEDVTASLDALVERGPLRIVVNCAGVGPPGKVLSRSGPLPLEDFERIVQINLFGKSAQCCSARPCFDHASLILTRARGVCPTGLSPYAWCSSVFVGYAV